MNLENLATKNDLSKVFHTLDFKIDKVKDDLENKMQKNHNEVMGVLDKQGVILERLDTELAGHQASYNRHGEILDDHEKRIGVLEVEPAA